MPIVKFTEQAVAEAKAPAKGRMELWDEALPGFGLRVSGTGRKTWQVMYRAAGRKRRMALGRYPALSLEIAREAAEDALREVARGRDPAGERASMTGGALTFEALAKASKVSVPPVKEARSPAGSRPRATSRRASSAALRAISSDSAG